MSDPKPELRPKTVDEAVLLLIEKLGPENCQTVAAIKTETELIGKLHHGLGRWVRNNFGLWQNNKALQEATGVSGPDDADDASGVILRALWEFLKSADGATIISKEMTDESRTD